MPFWILLQLLCFSRQDRRIQAKGRFPVCNIKIAYLLVAHKCPEQVNAFIDQLLDYGNCDVYVHVDKKNPELLKNIKKSSRVFVCSIFDVRWGSFEIVKAAVELMRAAMKSENKYSHIYFGSGQDLLVKQGLYEYLDCHPDNIFLEITGRIKNSDRASARYRICWPKKLMIRNDLHPYRFIRIAMQLLCRSGIVIRKNKVTLKNPVDFYEGHTWFIIPFAVMEYIISYLNDNPDYFKFWENSLASDLMFFQTIIMNSSFADKIKGELMYVNFGKTFGTMNHPMTITMDDIDDIKKGNYYCARKFEWNEKPSIDYFTKLVKEN